MSIKPTIRFSNSNNLRFIRLEDYSLLQSDTTRLYYDFDSTIISNDCYFTKIKQDLDLWVQFRTTYNNIKAFIVNDSEVEVEVTQYLTSGASLTDNRKQWQLTLNLASYLGYYHLRFEFSDWDKPQAIFQSEWFEVKTSFDNCLLIEWKNKNFNPYDDGIIWANTTQHIHIESYLYDYIPEVTKTVFESENYKLLTTQSQPIKTKKWIIEPLPDYILELLNIAMQHDYFIINSVRYNSEDTFETERQGETRLYPAQITLRVVEDAQGNAYEDYSEDQQITGEIPIIENFAIYAGAGLAIYAGTGKAIGYYTSEITEDDIDNELE